MKSTKRRSDFAVTVQNFQKGITSSINSEATEIANLGWQHQWLPTKGRQYQWLPLQQV